MSLGVQTARPPRSPRKSSAAKRRRRGGRALRGQRREELLAAVKTTSPGARPSELAQAIGISANQVHGLIAKARADKLLVKGSKGYPLKDWCRSTDSIGRVSSAVAARQRLEPADQLRRCPVRGLGSPI